MAALFHDLAAPGVQQLQPYLPGKPVEELERELGISDSIKLASNENPLGASTRALEAIAACSRDVNYYPDGSAFKLARRLADKYGVDPACLTFGNGSNDVLELVARAFLTSAHSAVYSQYAFAVYPIVVQAIGARANIAPAFGATHESMPLGHDPDAIVDSIEKDGTYTVDYLSMGSEGYTSAPARVMMTMAGDRRGTYFMPEIGDEVVVAFEGGDTSFPIILGAVWNDEAPPPDQAQPSTENNVRTIVSCSGH